MKTLTLMETSHLNNLNTRMKFAFLNIESVFKMSLKYFHLTTTLNKTTTTTLVRRSPISTHVLVNKNISINLLLFLIDKTNCFANVLQLFIYLLIHTKQKYSESSFIYLHLEIYTYKDYIRDYT